MKIRVVRISLFAIVLLSVALALSIFGIVLTYTRLTDEVPVATVTFEPVGKEEFNAYLRLPGEDIPRKYVIYGDQFRMDAQFVKLKPWANILGMDARYRLERLEGRFSDIEAQNSGQHRAYNLASKYSGSVSSWLVPWNFLVDAEYGSSTYTDISTQDVYTVYRSQFGLLVRAVPVADKADKAGMIDGLFRWLWPGDTAPKG
ncbi:hypothetical protein TH25_07910 [Thalassospira profundimaris]|uniref:Uncharacterized protein n=1 Tax=Thalassospira profundimaris TaxID=502049 RepID=A0A367XD68_9PROT|nr:hypothetical protein [Thalassospira profundimaris]RCK51615.1 hypothetical protein TH25_07910 [Thalassospira profundimaris]